jgi:hypothetical protein
VAFIEVRCLHEQHNSLHALGATTMHYYTSVGVSPETFLLLQLWLMQPGIVCHASLDILLHSMADKVASTGTRH